MARVGLINLLLHPIKICINIIVGWAGSTGAGAKTQRTT